MKVSADNVWASKSTLHIRVHVTGNDGEWRQKHYVSVPLNDIPEEAMQGLRDFYKEALGLDVPEDMPLF